MEEPNLDTVAAELAADWIQQANRNPTGYYVYVRRAEPGEVLARPIVALNATRPYFLASSAIPLNLDRFGATRFIRNALRHAPIYNPNFSNGRWCKLYEHCPDNLQDWRKVA